MLRKLSGSAESSAFKLQARRASASATTAHNISRALTDTDSMEISMQSTDTMLQPQQVTSPKAGSGHSSVDQQVMDQFTQMKRMLTGDNNTYTLLQLPGIGGIREERLSDI